MSGVAILFMVFVCSIVWGGFLLLLGWMIRSERRKKKALEKTLEAA